MNTLQLLSLTMWVAFALVLLALVFNLSSILRGRLNIGRKWRAANDVIETARMETAMIPAKAKLQVDMTGNSVWIVNEGTADAVEVKAVVTCTGDTDDYFASLTDEARMLTRKAITIPAGMGMAVPWLIRHTAPAMVSIRYRSEGLDEEQMAHVTTQYVR